MNVQITVAVDESIDQDPETPTEFLRLRDEYQDDRLLVEFFAKGVEPRLGLVRMAVAGKLDHTCESIALRFPQAFDQSVRDDAAQKLNGMRQMSREQLLQLEQLLKEQNRDRYGK